MEISRKSLTAIILTTFLATCLSTYGITTGWFLNGHRDAHASANVFYIFETAEGTWSGQAGNVITNLGECYVRNIMGFNNESDNNETKWISLSNDASPAVTWTKLTTEVTANGFARALGTVVAWNNGTDYAYNVSKTFTATADANELQCAGLNWNDSPDSDNNLFACAAFTQTTFNTGDNCTIVWVITWDAN